MEKTGLSETELNESEKSWGPGWDSGSKIFGWQFSEFVGMAEIIEGSEVQSDGTGTAVVGGAVIAAGAVAPKDGWYKVSYDVAFMGPAAAGQGVVVEHRNAANSATNRVIGACASGSNQYGEVERLRMLANERIRAIAGPTTGAASTYSTARITIVEVQ